MLVERPGRASCAARSPVAPNRTTPSADRRRVLAGRSARSSGCLLDGVAAELVAQRGDRPSSASWSSSWETKRAKSAAEMTGAATPRRTASLTVQRPSPESAATPRDALEVGGLRRGRATSRSSSHERTTLPCRHDLDARPATSMPSSRGVAGSRSPRRRPASSRTRCRCGPSSCSARRRPGRRGRSRSAGASASKIGCDLGHVARRRRRP